MLNLIGKPYSKPYSHTGSLISKLSPIAAVLEIKDRYTREHGRRVAIYARRLAQRIGLKATDVENIQLGGLLHDMGKIGLSARVLKNTRKQLPGDMMAEVRLHPLIGVAVLKDVDVPAAAIDCVQYHHEKIDGSGYPFGLKNDQIPLGAKIVRVADCFDAITTDRPYQQRKCWIEALGILRQISGTDLDPDLVEAFINDIKESGLVHDPSGFISLYSPSEFALS